MFRKPRRAQKCTSEVFPMKKGGWPPFWTWFTSANWVIVGYKLSITDTFHLPCHDSCRLIQWWVNETWQKQIICDQILTNVDAWNLTTSAWAVGPSRADKDSALWPQSDFWRQFWYQNHTRHIEMRRLAPFLNSQRQIQGLATILSINIL